MINPTLQKKLNEVFEILDIDKSDTLERHEVSNRFQSVDGKSNEADRFFRAIDTDQSGEISRDEFMVFWANVRLSGASEDRVMRQLD